MKILVIENTNIFSNLLKNADVFLAVDNIMYRDINLFKQMADLEDLVQKENITNIILDSKKSYGKNIWNTSFIEDKLDINIKSNLYTPLSICNICKKYKIHLTYIGDGCIFKDTNSSEPDLTVSAHSIVNIYNEKLITELYDNVLYLRVRYPISGELTPACYLMKLLSYKKIIDVDNSVSILLDLIPILFKMIEKNITGIYNFFGNNYINSINTILLLKHNFDSHISFNVISKEEHNELIGERSNVILNNNKLRLFCKENDIELKDTATSIMKTIETMKSKCKEIPECLCCKEKNYLLLDLGYQPLANDFHDEHYINNVYPLRLMYCKNCFHCQLSHSVNPDILFKNYKYVSGTSSTGRDFFKDNANFIHQYKGKAGNILDIACNDGSQLNFFRDLGWNTYGVDPAENICPIGEKEGHKIYCDFWTDEIAHKLPIMDVITAQNVFAHTPYIDNFLESCKLVMDTNTSLFIQTSQRDMIMNGEFDTTYHEHLSFYNTKSMNTLTQRHGLVLNRVLEHSIHGRSYIFEIKLEKNESIYNIDEHLEIENNLGLYNAITYDKFKINAEQCIENLKLTIKQYINKGYKSIGFGAAAKGQTLICYGNIDFDYIIDESPFKIGTYSPKLNIPIVSLDHFKEDKDEKILIVILAWNFAKEIKEKINRVRGNKDMVVIEKYFPKIVIS